MKKERITVRVLKWLEYFGVITAFLFQIVVLLSITMMIIAAIVLTIQREIELAAVATAIILLISIAFLIVSRAIDESSRKGRARTGEGGGSQKKIG